MSVPPPNQPFVSKRYASVEEFTKELGLTKQQFDTLDYETRNRFQSWVLQGQNHTEAAISDLSDNTQLAENTPEHTFARNAVIYWAMYKKRQKDGSPTAQGFKDDYLMEIEDLRKHLLKTRTTRAITVGILGKSQKNNSILLPSQLDTAFYNDI